MPATYYMALPFAKRVPCNGNVVVCECGVQPAADPNGQRIVAGCSTTNRLKQEDLAQPGSQQSKIAPCCREDELTASPSVPRRALPPGWPPSFTRQIAGPMAFQRCRSWRMAAMRLRVQPVTRDIRLDRHHLTPIPDEAAPDRTGVPSSVACRSGRTAPPQSRTPPWS